MRVEIHSRGSGDFPTLVGSHALAWDRLLDWIFADAHENRIGTLAFSLPRGRGLSDGILLRRDLTFSESLHEGVASVVVGRGRHNSGASRHYTVRFGARGWLSPRSPARVPGSGSEHTVPGFSAFTRDALLWAVPIRLTSMTKQAWLNDRAFASMRRVFVREASVPAYYRVEVTAA